MAHTNKTSLAFFLPGSRSLSSAEISDLPEEKRKAAIASGREGVWIEVPCPDGSCMKKNGKIVLEAVPVGHKEETRRLAEHLLPGGQLPLEGRHRIAVGAAHRTGITPVANKGGRHGRRDQNKKQKVLLDRAR